MAIANAEPAPDFAPLKIIKTELPSFPGTASAVGLKRGEARVAIAVDDTGRLADYLVVAYSQRAFADAAVEAIKTWKFEPLRIHGLPQGAVASLTFDFEAERLLVDLNQAGDDAAESLFRTIIAKPLAFSVCLPRDLDRIPTPIKVSQPAWPAKLVSRGQGARVTVQYYIDRQGRVRLPRVSSETGAAHDDLVAAALAAAAVSTVAQWRFEPPLAQGIPTVVLVEQDFNFKAPAP